MTSEDLAGAVALVLMVSAITAVIFILMGSP